MNNNALNYYRYYLKNEQATQAFAGILADYCESPLVITVSGELGSGKTTLIRALLQQLGVMGTIKSPSYSLVEVYELTDRKIFHIDLYRLNEPEELELIGWRDYLSEPAVFLIEWPEKATSFLPSIDLKFHLRDHKEGRMLEMQADSKKGAKILHQLLPQIKT